MVVVSGFDLSRDLSESARERERDLSDELRAKVINPESYPKPCTRNPTSFKENYGLRPQAPKW